MAFPAGVEPATLRLGGECSIQLSYENNIIYSRLSKSKKRKQATYRKQKFTFACYSSNATLYGIVYLALAIIRWSLKLVMRELITTPLLLYSNVPLNTAFITP